MSRRQTDDAELVELARAGDKDAFGELVRRHGALARRVALGMLGDRGLADEAVQEATLLAYLSLPRLRCPARFGSWLCGITINLARRCLRERRHLVMQELASDPHEAAELDSAYEAAELAAVVRDAVARLAAGQREATLLFYWQGLTHAEVAAELDISVGAVKNRLHQARASLTCPLAAVLDDHQEVTAMSTPAPAPPHWIEVSVAEVRRGESDTPDLRPHVVLLREQGGERTLPVWIGRFEATAIATNRDSAEMPRPMTYQLTANLLTAASTSLREIRITRLVEKTFYAVLVLDTPAGPAEVDARPSDAINLALVTGAPVMASTELLDDARATARSEWRQYPTTEAQLVSEVRQQHDEMTARLEGH